MRIQLRDSTEGGAHHAIYKTRRGSIISAAPTALGHSLLRILQHLPREQSNGQSHRASFSGSRRP